MADGTDAGFIIKKSIGAERFSLRFFGATQSIDPSGATLSLSNLGKKNSLQAARASDL